MFDKCYFGKCNYAADEYELDSNHIYCMFCGHIVHFNVKEMKKKMGLCLSCGAINIEYKNKRWVSYKVDSNGNSCYLNLIQKSEDNV